MVNEALFNALQNVEKLRLMVLNMDNFNLAEIKSYYDPPPEVYRVMAATFLFIGEPRKKVKVSFVLKYMSQRRILWQHLFVG